MSRGGQNKKPGDELNPDGEVINTSAALQEMSERNKDAKDVKREKDGKEVRMKMRMKMRKWERSENER